MGIDKVSSSKSSPTEGVRTGDVSKKESKDSPSAFDKVMKKEEEHAPEEHTKIGQKKQEGKKLKKEKRSLKDIPILHNLKSRTLEPSFKKVEKTPVDLNVQKAFKEVVEAVRVGVNRAGDKEVQLDLKSNVMDGLRIKISVHEGKVLTTLEVTTIDAKNALEAHIGELKEAFQQKGLPPADVQIQFKEEPKQQQDSQQQPRDSNDQEQNGEESEQQW